MSNSRFSIHSSLRLSRNFFINLLLFTCFFTFYYIFSIVVIPQAIPSSGAQSTIQASFSFVIAVTLFLASHIIRKFKPKYIIICSSAVSIASIFLFLSSSIEFSIMCIFIIGVFFSIAQLTSFTYFWNTTQSEERGRIGGIIGFISLQFFFISNYVFASSSDFFGKILIGIVLSIVAALAILLIRAPINGSAKKITAEYYAEKRTIILYSIPWILFSLINATLAKNISANTSELLSSSFYLFLVILQTVAALFGALGGGFIADHFGRRLTLALSVTLYGVSMVFRAFIANEVTFLFAFIAEGLSWGVLLMLYSFVIWGDLSNSKNCSKLYAIGLIAFYLATGIGQLPSFISEISLLGSALISCLMIFLSNLPIALAPELLSSDIREKMRLKKYMKTIKKIAKEADD